MKFLTSRWVLAGTLLISLAGNAGLCLALRRSYDRQLQQQIWPMGIVPATSAQIREGTVRGAPTILLVGDSRMEQWPLRDDLPFRLVQAGQGGMTTAQLHLRLPGLLREYHPAVVVIEAGINDLKYLGLHPEQSSALVRQTADHLEAMANLAREHDSRVLLLQIWPPSSPGLIRRFVWSSSIAPAVAQVNDRLRELERVPGGPRVIDLFREAGLEPTAGIYRDTLHLTRNSYERLDPAFQRVLELLVRRSQDHPEG